MSSMLVSMRYLAPISSEQQDKQPVHSPAQTVSMRYLAPIRSQQRNKRWRSIGLRSVSMRYLAPISSELTETSTLRLWSSAFQCATSRLLALNQVWDIDRHGHISPVSMRYLAPIRSQLKKLKMAVTRN